MSKRTLIALVLFAMVSSGELYAQSGTQSFPHTEQTPESWTVVSNSNGIKVLMMETMNNGNGYLNLKFENTSGTEVVFAWELKDKNGKIIANTARLSLAAGASLSGLNDATLNGGNMNLLLEKGQSLVDFTIHINKI